MIIPRHSVEYTYIYILWGFPEMGDPQNGWFIVENAIINIDDLGVPPF
jgi:hypothetical protein